MGMTVELGHLRERVSPYREGAPILCELAILILSLRKTVWLSPGPRPLRSAPGISDPGMDPGRAVRCNTSRGLTGSGIRYELRIRIQLLNTEINGDLQRSYT